MKKTTLRVILAAGSLALASWAQHANTCAVAENKQDCQDCCVAQKQAAFSQCQAADDKQACLDAASDAFNACMDSCKALPNETGPGEAHTNPQGN